MSIEVTAGRGKQFVYQSAPFAADTEVSGFFKLSAWIARLNVESAA